jgi:hypothetical protein
VAAAPLQRPYHRESAQSRRLSDLSRHGIGLEDPCWTWSTSYATAKHCRQFNWVTFLRPLSQCALANPQLPSTLRWLAASWVTGCGGEFRPVTFASSCSRLRMMRPLLIRLLTRYGALETVTPRQCQETFRELYFTEEGNGRAERRSLGVALDSTQDLYRLRAYLPTGLAVEPFPVTYRQSMLVTTRP